MNYYAMKKRLESKKPILLYSTANGLAATEKLISVSVKQNAAVNI